MSCLIDPFPYGFPVVKSWTGGSLSLTARWSSVAISWSYLRFGFGRGWGTVGGVSLKFKVYATHFVMFLEAAEF